MPIRLPMRACRWRHACCRVLAGHHGRLEREAPQQDDNKTEPCNGEEPGGRWGRRRGRERARAGVQVYVWRQSKREREREKPWVRRTSSARARTVPSSSQIPPRPRRVLYNRAARVGHGYLCYQVPGRAWQLAEGRPRSGAEGPGASVLINTVPGRPSCGGGPWARASAAPRMTPSATRMNWATARGRRCCATDGLRNARPASSPEEPRCQTPSPIRDRPTKEGERAPAPYPSLTR